MSMHSRLQRLLGASVMRADAFEARHRQRATFEALEDRRLLSIWTPAVDSTWFSEVVERGTPEYTIEAITWKGQSAQAISREWIVQLTEDATSEAESAANVMNLLGSSPFDAQVVRGLGMKGLVLVEVCTF